MITITKTSSSICQKSTSSSKARGTCGELQERTEKLQLESTALPVLISKHSPIHGPSYHRVVKWKLKCRRSHKLVLCVPRRIWLKLSASEHYFFLSSWTDIRISTQLIHVTPEHPPVKRQYGGKLRGTRKLLAPSRFLLSIHWHIQGTLLESPI